MRTLVKKGSNTKFVLTPNQVQVSVPTNSSACLAAAGVLAVFGLFLLAGE